MIEQVKVHLRDFRIAPRKARLVANLVRKQSLKKAVTTLEFVSQKMAKPLSKLFHSAIVIATTERNLEFETLRIKELIINEGKKLKRIRPAAKGRAVPLWHRFSHISLTLSGIVRKSGATLPKKNTSSSSNNKKLTAEKK